MTPFEFTAAMLAGLLIFEKVVGALLLVAGALCVLLVTFNFDDFFRHPYD